MKEKPSAEVSPSPYPKLTVGDELRLTCKVNKVTVAIKWKRNDDQVIPRAQIDTRVDDRLSELFIEDVVEGDSGEYSCEARNTPGIVARSTVKINVDGKINHRIIFNYFVHIDMHVVQVVFHCHCQVMTYNKWIELVLTKYCRIKAERLTML